MSHLRIFPDIFLEVPWLQILLQKFLLENFRGIFWSFSRDSTKKSLEDSFRFFFWDSLRINLKKNLFLGISAGSCKKNPKRKPKQLLKELLEEFTEKLLKRSPKFFLRKKNPCRTFEEILTGVPERILKILKYSWRFILGKTWWRNFLTIA